MILVGGENLIDFIQIEAAGEKPVYQANPGGSPYNCAKAIGRQQVAVGYITPISADPLGQLLAAGLSGAGVVLCGERRVEPTSLAVVSLENSIASYQFYRQRTAERLVSREGLANACPADVSAFHLGSLAITDGADADVWTEFYVSMAERGVFTSLDPNIRPAFITDRSAYFARLDRLLSVTDLLKLSDEDLAWLVPGQDIGAAAGQLARRSKAKLVIVTMGGQGAFALHSGQTVRVDAAPIETMVDTVGAGDTFMATLLATLSQTDNLSKTALGNLNQFAVRDLLIRAATAAALNCEQSGCNPPSLKTLNGALGQTQTI